VRLTGGKRLNQQLRRLPVEIENDLRKVVQKSGREFVTVARALVPVDSGELKSTIEVEYKEHGMAAEITAGGTKQETIIQAHTVEGGRNPSSARGGMAAQPYMNRAAKHLSKKVKGQYKRAINKAVRSVTNG
jgi:hypothetical protein